MPITVACQCGAKFAAQDRLAGKTVKCPKCSSPLKVPALESTAAPAAAPQTTPVAAVTTPAPAAGDDLGIGDILADFGIQASKTGQRCPACQADMQPGAILCVTCGYNVQTGKQVRSKSDQDAINRRAEIHRQAQLAAEKREKVNNAKTSKYTDLSAVSFAWIREGGDLKSVFTSTGQIVMTPQKVFRDLPPDGETGLAISFPTLTFFAVELMYVALILGFLTIMGIIGGLSAGASAFQWGAFFGAMTAIWAYALAVAAVVAVITVLFIPIFSLCCGGLAHLLLKFVGKSELGFLASFRVTQYVLGASIGIMVVPCFAPFSVLILPLHLTLGYAIHHRVHPGIAAGAMALGLLAGSVLFYIVVFVIGASAVAALTAAFAVS